MSEFSEYLEKSIKSRGFTNSEFAKICNIERTLLQKYLSGQRLFKKPEVFSLICDKLRLSPVEREQMEVKYRKALLGEQLYEQRKNVRELIENFQQLSGGKALSGKRNYQIHVSTASRRKMDFYYNRQEFLHDIYGILCYEFEKTECRLEMIFQPVYQELEGMLMRAGAGRDNVRICHVICMEQEVYEEGGQYNLQILKSLVSFLCSNLQYNVRYYYEHVENHINSMNILPNLILTPEFVIGFDYEMQQGMIFSDPELRRFYQEIFDSVNNRCSDFILYQQGGIDSLQFHSEQSPVCCSLQWSPCIAQCVTRKLLEDVLTPQVLEQKDVVQDILELFGRAQQHAGGGVLKRSRRCISSQKKGLKAFWIREGVRSIRWNYIVPLRFSRGWK